MNLNLEGKNAVVCGSTAGIGEAAAMQLAAMGAEVILVARNPEKLAAVHAALPRPKGQSHRWFEVHYDRDWQTESQAITAFLQEAGKDPATAAHILVNNTGGPPGGPAHAAAPAEYLQAFTQHLIWNQVMVQACLEGMKNAGYGRIINVISTSVKQPLPNLGVSNTIRGAVANWAKTLANELGGFGITVNNVLPGATATGRLDAIIQSKAAKGGTTVAEATSGMQAAIPAGRFGEPSELGDAIAFLASPAAAYINGINLPVDGGRTKCL